MNHYQLLLLLFLSRFTSVCGNDDEESPLEIVFKKQKDVYERYMKNLMDNAELGQITVDAGKTKGTFELYKLGKTNMPLKSVFDILQSLYHYFEDQAKSKELDGEAMKNFIEQKRFFEVNIGGDDYTFGIRPKQDKEELMVSTLEGKEPKYREIFQSFENYEHGIQAIAKQLFESANSPVNKQPNWKKLINDGDVREHMRFFSVCTQIAEGARPSDKFFKVMKDAANKVFSIKTKNMKELREFLEKNMFKPIIDSKKNHEEAYEDYKRFLETMKEYETKVTSVRKEKNAIKILPEKKSSFFSQLKTLKLDIVDDEEYDLRKHDKDLRKLLKEYNVGVGGKEEKQKEQLKRIKEAITKFQNVPEGTNDDAIREEVLDSLPTPRVKGKATSELNLEKELADKILLKHNDKFFEEIKSVSLKEFLTEHGFEKANKKSLQKLDDAVEQLKLPAEDDRIMEERREAVEKALPPLSASFLETFSKAARKAATQINNEIKEELKSNANGETSGRIPGAGGLMRELLKKVSEGELGSFQELEQATVFLEHDGLTRSRRKFLDFLSFSQASYIPLPDFEEDANMAGRSATPKDAAVMDDLKEGVDDKVEGLCQKYYDKPASSNVSSYGIQADFSCGRNNKNELVDDSLKWKGDKLMFETMNEEGIKTSHELTYPLEKSSTSKYFKEKAANGHEVSAKIGAGLGAYGTFVAIVSSIKQFEDGNYGQGTLSAAQALHSLGGLTGLNRKLSRKIAEKSLNFAAEKFGVERILSRLSKPIAEGLGKAGKVFSRFLGDIPFVGLAFDIYFITEDIKDLQNKNSKTPKFLKVSHLVLDVTTTVLSLVGTAVPEAEPIIEPIIIALTIVRLTIDDFYTDIKSELSEVKGKSFGARVKAFFKGFGEALADIFTLGLFNQIKQLNKASQHDKEFFKNITDPEKYFNKTLAENGTIDFNGGYMSQFGGFLSVTLNDDGSFTMELPQVYSGDTPRKVTKTFKYAKPAKDVILGLGNVVSPQYIHQTAKLWLLIPVKSYDIVQSFLTHKSSRYGTYFGNKFDNNFYAAQENVTTLSNNGDDDDKDDDDNGKDLLNDYHYNIYGEKGDDKFYLGPQITFSVGGEGKDLYFIPSSGGRLTIDNFALDENMDTLFLDLNYRKLHCRRIEQDLVISHGESHVVLLKRWFLLGKRHDYFRHINILTKDEAEIQVTHTSVDGNQYQTACQVVSIDKSSSKVGVNLSMADAGFENVKRVVGSKFSDVIYGNQIDNLLVGGMGNDVISGKDGSDIYLIRSGDGSDTIDNFSTDKMKDTIMFEINYADISVERKEQDLVLSNSKAPNNMVVTMKSWFNGSQYQHAVFISNDSITFLASSLQGSLMKEPITIDLSKHKDNATVDLESRNPNKEPKLNKQAMREVKLLLDSPNDDRLIGNFRNNIISCSGGSDYLQGNSGSDTYVVKQTCNDAKILNFDADKKPQFDLLLLDCPSSKIHMKIANSDLLFKCKVSSEFDVTLINWFQSLSYQHLMIKTRDQWTFLPPEKKEGFSAEIEPYEIETKENCSGQLKTFDFRETRFKHVQKFLANSSKCRYNIIGNNLNNYINPGPSDSYGKQTLKGANGSDTYVFGHNYGINNEIENYATDEQYDHLMIDVIFDDIVVTHDGHDVKLSSRSPRNSVTATLLNYFKGTKHQHILIYSADGYCFKIKMIEYAVKKEILVVDFSTSSFSTSLSAISDESLINVRAMVGSTNAANHIEGGKETMRIIGGNINDHITGGSFSIGEDINGMGGDDYIDGRGGDDNIIGGKGNDEIMGGTGNDVIYGGEGSDIIDGETGSDTVVFRGNGKSKTGVLVDLAIGRGYYADAEGDKFASIERIFGSEYSDTLIGNDDDNVIRGYGGEDYMIPGGGFDVLQGGLDSDVYDMKNAFGFKTINNFATDKTIDRVLLSSVSRKQICHFYKGHDLFINVDFNHNDYNGSMGRIISGEENLQIKLVFWSSNATYQHLHFIFSGGEVSSQNDFPEQSRQMISMINGIINKPDVLRITLVSKKNIKLRFHYPFINDSHQMPRDTHFELVHTGYSSPRRFPIVINATSKYSKLKVTGLKHGVRQLFSVSLVSCGVVVAVSPLKAERTHPNPPGQIAVSALTSNLDGFLITWNPPTKKTDPNAFYYNYIIRYWKRGSSRQSHTIHHKKLFLHKHAQYNLEPSTIYKVSIASWIKGTIGKFSSPRTVRTGYVTCQNFFNLPSRMHIKEIRYSNAKLIAKVYCDRNYKVVGVKRLVCNETSSQPPRCGLIHCDVPSSSTLKAFLRKGNKQAANKDKVKLKCFKNFYQSTTNNNTFSSICNRGVCNPPLLPCVQLPACSRYPALQNGRMDPPFSYLNKTITFSCDKYYTRTGRKKNVCR